MIEGLKKYKTYQRVAIAVGILISIFVTRIVVVLMGVDNGFTQGTTQLVIGTVFVFLAILFTNNKEAKDVAQLEAILDDECDPRAFLEATTIVDFSPHAIRPTQINIIVYRGIAAADLGQTHEAIKVIDLLESYYNQLGSPVEKASICVWCYDLSKRCNDGAREEKYWGLIEEFLNQKKKSSKEKNMLAWYYESMKRVRDLEKAQNYQGLIDLYESYLSDSPESNRRIYAEWTFHLAEFYGKLGDKESETRCLEYVIKFAPKMGIASKAASML